MTHCLFFSMLALRSSISSMGDEEESRELSEGLKEGELLSPCSTDSVLGRSSRACARGNPNTRVIISSTTFSTQLFKKSREWGMP